MKINNSNQLVFSDLPRPRNAKSEVLFTLIEQGNVSIKDFPYLSGFRTRVSELVRSENLTLESQNLKGVNKFGNTYVYVNHLLPESQKAFARELYAKINS